MHPVEITWYKFLVLLTAAMGIGFGITNVVYFNRIRVNDDCNEISSGFKLIRKRFSFRSI